MVFCVFRLLHDRDRDHGPCLGLDGRGSEIGFESKSGVCVVSRESESDFGSESGVGAIYKRRDSDYKGVVIEKLVADKE